MTQTTRRIAIIGAPVDLGAGRRGVDMGPSAVRYASLRARLAELGHQVFDTGNVSIATLEELPAPAPGEKLRYLEPIAAMSRELAQRVAQALSDGYFPLIVGGDHTLSIGSVSGVAQRVRPLGVLWIDAHGDFNTADTTPSGNIHGMSVAALTGRGHASLTRILGEAAAIDAHNVVYIGLRDLDAGEKQLMRAAGVHVFTMHDVDRHGIAEIIERALSILGNRVQGVHLSLDMDSLDPVDAPGVGTPVKGGLTYREAHVAMEILHMSGTLVSMDVVEVNPILDQHNKTAELAVELVCSALGKRIYL
jgi:arginase